MRQLSLRPCLPVLGLLWLLLSLFVVSGCSDHDTTPPKPTKTPTAEVSQFYGEMRGINQRLQKILGSDTELWNAYDGKPIDVKKLKAEFARQAAFENWAEAKLLQLKAPPDAATAENWRASYLKFVRKMREVNTRLNPRFLQTIRDFKDEPDFGDRINTLAFKKELLDPGIEASEAGIRFCEEYGFDPYE